MRVTRPPWTVASSGQPPPQSRLQATGSVFVASFERAIIRIVLPRFGPDRGRIPDAEGRGRESGPGPGRSGGAVSLRGSSLS